VIFIVWILQSFVAQIDGKFLVHFHETAAGIVNLLRKTNRAFVRINLFDVTSATAGATNEFTDVPSTSIWQFFPMLKFSFVLCARSHSRES